MTEPDLKIDLPGMGKFALFYVLDFTHQDRKTNHQIFTSLLNTLTLTSNHKDTDWFYVIINLRKLKPKKKKKCEENLSSSYDIAAYSTPFYNVDSLYLFSNRFLEDFWTPLIFTVLLMTKFGQNFSCWTAHIKFDFSGLWQWLEFMVNSGAQP